MKNIAIIVTVFLFCFFFSSSHIQAFQMMNSDPDNGTACKQCHVTGNPNTIHKYEYSTDPASWHKKISGYSHYVSGGCNICHDDTSWIPYTCGPGPSKDKGCKTCHNSNPPEGLPNRDKIDKSNLPCNWPYRHHNVNRYPCLKCHTGCPTLVELSSLNATASNMQVTITWVTESEIDNVGFNLYRAESTDGDYIKINDSLIPAEGSPSEGAVYTFVDDDVKNRKTYYYKLEDVDLAGTSTLHGPVSATPQVFRGIQK